MSTDQMMLSKTKYLEEHALKGLPGELRKVVRK